MARFKTTERSGPVKEIADCFKEFSLNTRDVLFEEDVIENFDYTERSPPPFFTAGFTGKNENSAERLVISDTARKTCETVLVGFEMATSENILMNGDIAMDFYNHTENAQKMKYDLDTNEVIWKNYFTPDAIRLHQVHGLLEAIEKHDYTEILKIYYRAQHLHTLNAQDNPIEIPVYINRSQLNRKWVPHIEHAIETINEATPGMNLFETSERKVSKIRIGVDELCGPTMALTRNGSISKVKKKQLKPFIHLGNEWKESQMPGTSIHELMHALRFHHEMQRPDSKMYLDFDKNYDPAYSMKKDIFLTRFDPFSVMMYPEGEHTCMKRKEGDPIWKLKQKSDVRCQELSELNKVALNLTYKPCTNKSKNYSPKLSIQTEMLYCGRQVMSTHNQVGKATTDGFCGPNNWANCSACRVITRIKGKGKQSTHVPKLAKSLGKGKWQGLSGLFYCGKREPKFETDLKHLKTDGICGPDTGVPCNDCGEELFNGYSIALCDAIFKPKQ